MDEPDKLPLLQLGLPPAGDQAASRTTRCRSSPMRATRAPCLSRPRRRSATRSCRPSTGWRQAARPPARRASARPTGWPQQSFVKDGVNRVMLATDGDFNVGQTDDDDLKRLIEEKRKSGVFLSVFGFGRGNLNDQMMQTIAQNGNGTAAYIDTLAEAEKVLVEDASSTLFTDRQGREDPGRVQSGRVAEYRLIGYETRALNREDFNNDQRRCRRDRLRPFGDGDLRDHAEGQPGAADRRSALRPGDDRQSRRHRQRGRICLRQDPLQAARRRTSPS